MAALGLESQLMTHRSVIQRYGAGGFTIDGVRHEGSILIVPSGVHSLNIDDISAITFGMLEPLFSADACPELLILGIGNTHLPVPATLRQAFAAQSISCESMDTGAACRTFNILLVEDRRVAALLIAV